MTQRTLAQSVMLNSIDDYSGLWEVIGEVVGTCPGLNEDDQREAGRAVVQLLLDHGWVRLYECLGEDRSVVGAERAGEVLDDAASWVQRPGTVEFRIGATQAGEQAFAVRKIP